MDGIKKWVPDRKWFATGIGGLLAFLAIMAIEQFGGVDVPLEVEASIIGLFGWLLQYLVPPSAQDIYKRLDDYAKKYGAPDEAAGA